MTTERASTSKTFEETEQTNEPDDKMELAVYSRRWLILTIACIENLLRGYNTVCYGPVNNVLSEYFRVQPWQVDWIFLTHSVFYLFMPLPMSWFTLVVNFRHSLIIACNLLVLAFSLTSIGFSMRSGFPSIIVGQCIMGCTTILAVSLKPSLVAIWFPTSEVATALALQIIAAGIGSSVGSIVTPITVNIRMSNDEIGLRLMWMFVAMTITSLFLTIVVYFFVTDEPSSPPSQSRAAILKEKKEKGNSEKQKFYEALKQCQPTLKELFCDLSFVCVWMAFGISIAAIRTNTMLLSSVLHTAFNKRTSLNEKAGFALMGGWIGSIFTGFIAGPLITKTKKYKLIVFVSIGLECLFSLAVMLGVREKSLIVVLAGVVGMGSMYGIAVTSLVQLSLEVTYPKPPMLVMMVNLFSLGIWRLFFPIAERFLLIYVGPTLCCAVPFTFLLFVTIFIGAVKMPMKRRDADMLGETILLIAGQKAEQQQ